MATTTWDKHWYAVVIAVAIDVKVVENFLMQTCDVMLLRRRRVTAAALVQP